MKRRDFIALLAGAAALPVAARAQQAANPVVGFLHSQSPEAYSIELAAFRRSLQEAGFVEGRNLTVEYRWANNQLDRLPILAADLARRQVTVIAAPGNIPSPLAARSATTTIPVIFYVAVDPVAFGLVASLSRPGGNLTGVASLNVEVAPKRLELIYELVSNATTIGLLVNPSDANTEPQVRDLQTAARALGVRLHVVYAGTDQELDAAFASLAELRAGGLVVGADTFFTSRSERIATLALRHAIPAIFQFRNFATSGGLMSYGGDNTDQFRLVGVYTGRILNGARPADLPVQQVTKVELIINLKTAKSLGLNVPLALLTRADEVIE